MRRTILLSLLSVLLAFALPVLLSPGGQAETEEAPEEAPGGETAPAAAAARSSGPALPHFSADADTPLTLHTAAGDVETTMADYLPFALAGEMPASFAPEALKAQAVALRTYALFYRENRKDAHPEADVCDSPGCCAACADAGTLRERWGAQYEENLARLTAAVEDTDGQYLSWEGAPIFAVFHASSQGVTEAGAALGVDRPYLVSVGTPETADTVDSLVTTAEVSAENFRTTVLTACPDAALDPAAPETWVESVSLNAAGRVAQVRVGGVTVSGLAMRQMFSLRSTDFTLGWDGDGQRFLFRVRGYGHGVGMSQHGADLSARAGESYAEILAHYYPGAVLSGVPAT